MVSSALIELQQSKKELLTLMEKQAHTLLESLLISSNNALMTYNYLEISLEERLLNNANIIRQLYEKGNINNTVLEKYARENNIFRINIFDRNGKHKFGNHQITHPERNKPRSSGDILDPIFNDLADTVIRNTRYKWVFWTDLTPRNWNVNVSR